MAALTAPLTLAKIRHWVVHKNKAPTGRSGMSGWTLAENWFTYNEAIEKLKGDDYDGLGFIVARESGRKDRQIIGGDLDNCRDPITGEGSTWAVKILKDLDTCSAPSYSGCGYRFFCLGKLPDGLNEIEGHGADDLPDEMKEHILTAKPSARAKLDKYGPAEVWNGLEIYEDGPKHLTITGQWLPEYPVEPQYRAVELLAVIAPYLKEAPPANSPPRAAASARKTSGSKFPQLNILDVIDTSGFSDSGSELVGAHPGIGSVTGANLKVNVEKNSWCSFHDDLKRGGDPWVWLACECGAVPWEEAGSGVLTDPIVISTTMMHAAKRGLIPETPDIVAAFRRSRVEKKAEEPKGPTVLDAIKALAGVCDGATTKDGMGFSKFDREANEDLIDKVVSGEELSPREEKKAYSFLKKYKKQLKGLGIDYDQIGHIVRDCGEGCENALAGIIDRIPAWIEEHHFKTVSDTKKIYHYDHGVYLDNGETILEALIEAEFPDFTNNKMVADIIGKVKRRTYTDRELFNTRRVINVKNGLLDLETLQLQPHTPDYLSTAQIDVLYNPEAKAPNIAKFLQDVAQSGDVVLIEEIIGWLLWPDYHIHKAIMLVGPGRNGKGTLLRLITAFLGRKSISNVTLQDLVSDTFAKADLYGKLANIGGDLPSKDLSDTAAFRNLTGGDDNRAQEKYRAAFNFRNKAKMAFSANVLPRSQDDTYAFYSRWILLEFLNRFILDDGTADPNLDEKLQTPVELSGLLNIALNGLKRLKDNGWKFSYTKTVEDVERMYKRNANPVFAFLMDECVSGGAMDYIEKSAFFDQFKNYAKTHNLRPISTTRFVELLKDQTEIPVSDFRPWVDHGDRPRCWAGVKLKTPLTKKEENGEKNPKPAEKGQKTENETDSGGVQSQQSMVGFHSLSWPTELEKREEYSRDRGEIEYKQTMDGMDCDPLIAVYSVGSKGAERAEHPTETKEDPDLAKFKRGMKKRHCLMCGEHFSYDLGIHWHGGYICARCHREGPPAPPVKADTQTKIGDEEATA